MMPSTPEEATAQRIVGALYDAVTAKNGDAQISALDGLTDNFDRDVSPYLLQQAIEKQLKKKLEGLGCHGQGTLLHIAVKSIDDRNPLDENGRIGLMIVEKIVTRIPSLMWDPKDFFDNTLMHVLARKIVSKSLNGANVTPILMLWDTLRSIDPKNEYLEALKVADGDGYTPCHILVLHDMESTLRLMPFREAGVLGFRDSRGNTVLHTLPSYKSYDEAMQLMRYMLGVNEKDFRGALSIINNNGDTPLHVAASRSDCSPELIEQLTVYWPGALFTRNKYGKTPLDLALQMKQTLERDKQRAREDIENLQAKAIEDPHLHREYSVKICAMETKILYLQTELRHQLETSRATLADLRSQLVIHSQSIPAEQSERLKKEAEERHNKALSDIENKYRLSIETVNKWYGESDVRDPSYVEEELQQISYAKKGAMEAENRLYTASLTKIDFADQKAQINVVEGEIEETQARYNATIEATKKELGDWKQGFIREHLTPEAAKQIAEHKEQIETISSRLERLNRAIKTLQDGPVEVVCSVKRVIHSERYRFLPLPATICEFAGLAPTPKELDGTFEQKP